MAKGVFDRDKLYLYVCGDGITRLRCGRHVAGEQRLAPRQIWRVLKVGLRTCVECEYERRDGVFLEAPEDLQD